MIYVTKADILTRIKQNDLTVIMDNNADSFLDSPELDAINEVSSYLSVQYDTGVIFEPDQDEEDKNDTIKRIIIDVMIYNLHCLVNPRNIPEFRIQRRDDAIKWLKLVANPRSNVNADFLPKRDYGEKRGTDISWGSKPKRDNKY